MNQLSEDIEQGRSFLERVFIERCSNQDETDLASQNAAIQEEAVDFRESMTDIINLSSEEAFSQLRDGIKQELEAQVDAFLSPVVSSSLGSRSFGTKVIKQIKTIEVIKRNFLEAFPPFQGLSEWVQEIFNEGIVYLYREFLPDLTKVAYKKLESIRASEEGIGSNHALLTDALTIVQHLPLFKTALEAIENWPDIYCEKAKEQTIDFIVVKLADASMDKYLSVAMQRMQDEVMMAVMFDLDTWSTADNEDIVDKVKCAVLDTFCTSYCLKTEEADSQYFAVEDLFMLGHPGSLIQRGMVMFGESTLFASSILDVKEKVRLLGISKLEQWFGTHNDWREISDVGEPLRVLVQYKKECIEKLLSPGEEHFQNNLCITGFLEEIFKTFLITLFPPGPGGKSVEKLLAEFVAYIVYGDSYENGSLSGTHSDHLDDVDCVIKSLENKDAFMEQLRHEIKIYTPIHARRMNKTWRRFLRGRDIFDFVPPEVFEHLDNSGNLWHLHPADIGKNKVAVLQVQTNEPLNYFEDNHFLLPQTLDRACQITVSVKQFCGRRKSLYIRVSPTQLQLLKMMMTWRQLKFQDICRMLCRDDINSGAPTTIREEVQAVVESFMHPHALLKREPASTPFDPLDEIYVNEWLKLSDPYIELQAPFPEADDVVPTDNKYRMDHHIVDFVKHNDYSTRSSVVASVATGFPEDLSLIRERLKYLIDRKYISEAEQDKHILHYVSP